MAEVTLGGERLGSGNRNKQYLHNYERSTHNTGYVWRSTMSAGTLVPFMSELALPGDTFDIDLGLEIMTHPTIGPLFGSYKAQLDVFLCPIRLYQAALHMNALGIGLNMASVKLPQIEFPVMPIRRDISLDNQQVNSSSLLKYLGISGGGHNTAGNTQVRYFNAIPYLSYFDIYKCYYANKQEGVGAIIHHTLTNANITEVSIDTDVIPDTAGTPINVNFSTNPILNVVFDGNPESFDPNKFILVMAKGGETFYIAATSIWNNFYYGADYVSGSDCQINDEFEVMFYQYTTEPLKPNLDLPPEIVTFPLEYIDCMRMQILQTPVNAPFIIGGDSLEPYNLPFDYTVTDGVTTISTMLNQEGLLLKTYQSDLFNNWVNTEWIDGDNGINAITAVNITDNQFTINELMLSRKIYDMLMRVAVSGGTYDDWLDAVYTHDRTRSAENPMYLGGMIQELVFQEVISNSQTADQPLGTLAGRGRLKHDQKGGHVVVKCDEPSYVIGIVSLTPRIDYSQGNKWDVNLKTLDDLHKPGLDQIGFQDLITDQMAWYDTEIGNDGNIITKSAGKQPAWLNYMTNVNKVYGNFADENSQMFMVLNRRYDVDWIGDYQPIIKDLTTYIDPSKFNHIFAETRRDSQNFWTQISVNITARRKMSAKQIPNL